MSSLLANSAVRRRSRKIFFTRDWGMIFFLTFLVFNTVILPAVELSNLGRFALSLLFALTLILGAFATIHHRLAIYIVIGLTVSTFTADRLADDESSRALAELDTSLRLCCLAILVFMTLKRTLRPGKVNLYRVADGIAGYLLLGFAWAFAYQLVAQQIPGAIHFQSTTLDVVSQQPRELIYFSFVTLTTVGYGDVQPIHPAARSLAIAEALVGQLYLAILIASLVGLALQQRTEEVR